MLDLVGSGSGERALYEQKVPFDLQVSTPFVFSHGLIRGRTLKDTGYVDAARGANLRMRAS
jgi:hypothetical protein